MRYQVNSWDICVPGFERLRNQNEVLLMVSVDRESSIGEIQEELKRELDNYDPEWFPDGFDYGQATAEVLAAVEADQKAIYAGLADCPPPSESGSDDWGNWPSLYLYLEVSA